MKFNTHRQSGYSSTLADSIVGKNKPVHSISDELAP